MRTDYHVHTNFSDGKNTPAEVAASALALGLTELGFSDHASMPVAQDWAIRREKTALYFQTIRALADEYRGRLRILCGLEQDFFSDPVPADCDYVIGSCHYILKDDCYLPVDESRQAQITACRDRFGGDIYRMIEAYYSMEGQAAEKTGADIIGHLDLITKFNEGECLFSESDPRYIRAATDAIDRLLMAGKPFEINTGAISRGYRTAPYPAKPLRDYILARGGRFLLSSDSHARDTLCYRFGEYDGLPGLVTELGV